MDYDVIIVGARIAGSTLAILLAQREHRVLLLDRAHFPSDTLSTHFFRHPALHVFEQLGVLEEVKSAAPHLTTVWNYIDGHIVGEPVKTGDDHLSYFMCVRRITLDWILAQRVIHQPGVDFHQGAHVKGLIWQDGWVTGVRWSEAGGLGEASAPVVIGAGGFYSTLAKSLKPATQSQFPRSRCMYYTYYQGIQPFEDNSFAEHHF